MKLQVFAAGLILSHLCVPSWGQSQQGQSPDAPPTQNQTASAPPAAAPPTAAQAFQQNGGSLLRATLTTQADPGQAPLASVSFLAVPEPEPRTLKKHDLVTIIVREESEYSSDGSLDFSKEAEFDARIDEFIQLDTLVKEFQLKGGGVSDPVPSIKMSGSRNVQGDGSIDREDTLIMRVTAEVVDVKPNGTLVLQARQRIVTDDEEQEFVLSGVCRAEDVSPDNTILSTQLFDKELRKFHNGTVRQATKRGWLSKLLDAVSPF